MICKIQVSKNTTNKGGILKGFLNSVSIYLHKLLLDKFGYPFRDKTPKGGDKIIEVRSLAGWKIQ